MPEATNNEIPTYTDVPVGIDAQGTRREFDSLGSVEVPADRYWGAQTQRSLIHFSIGDDRMPSEVTTPTACQEGRALVNQRAGRLSAAGKADRAGGRRGHRTASSTMSSRCSSGRPAAAPRPT